MTISASKHLIFKEPGTAFREFLTDLYIQKKNCCDLLSRQWLNYLTKSFLWVDIQVYITRYITLQQPTQDTYLSNCKSGAVVELNYGRELITTGGGNFCDWYCRHRWDIGLAKGWVDLRTPDIDDIPQVIPDFFIDLNNFIN